MSRTVQSLKFEYVAKIYEVLAENMLTFQCCIFKS